MYRKNISVFGSQAYQQETPLFESLILQAMLCIPLLLYNITYSLVYVVRGTELNGITVELNHAGLNYFVRATRVYRERTFGWTQGLAIGQNCHLVSAPCSLGLVCVGPPGQQQRCSIPGSKGSPCENEYVDCKSSYVCHHGICTEPSKRIVLKG